MWRLQRRKLPGPRSRWSAPGSFAGDEAPTRRAALRRASSPTTSSSGSWCPWWSPPRVVETLYDDEPPHPEGWAAVATLSPSQSGTCQLCSSARSSGDSPVGTGVGADPHAEAGRATAIVEVGLVLLGDGVEEIPGGEVVGRVEPARQLVEDGQRGAEEVSAHAVDVEEEAGSLDHVVGLVIVVSVVVRQARSGSPRAARSLRAGRTQARPRSPARRLAHPPRRGGPPHRRCDPGPWCR